MATFGIELVPTEPATQIADFSLYAEKIGFEYVWIPEHYNNRETFVTLSAAALKTSRCKIGSGVTNPYARHPAMIASAIATVDEISGGRCVLGLGAGDRLMLSCLGILREKPVEKVRESVEVIRQILREGQGLEFNGATTKLFGPHLNFRLRPQIPVYIGAQGVLMLQLAGEIGDGVLINASQPPDIFHSIELIRRGVRRSGRPLGSVDLVAYSAFSTDEDEAAAKKAARYVVAFIVGGASEKLLQKHDIREEDAQKVRRSIVKGDFKGAAGQVTEEMVEAFAITGKPNRCIEKMSELLKTGVTQIVFGSPLGRDKPTALRLLKEKILPNLRP